MLAVRAWRSSLLVATKRPILVANVSSDAGSNLPLNNLLDSLKLSLPNVARIDREPPPTAGADGYPPPNPPKAVPSKNAMQDFLLTSLKPRYRLHCHSTRNNTITTFTKPTGHTIAWFSGGSCGFKKVNRSSYEAGYQCAVRMFKKIEDLSKTQPIELELFFKGFGQGRDALYRALLTSEGEAVRPMVVSITDRTAIKIGGTRAKKTRRL